MKRPGMRLLVACTILFLQSAQAADVRASLVWAERLELGMLVSGVVGKVPASLGGQVRRGDPLVQLDARGFRSQVKRRKAEVLRAEVLLEEAQREDERSLELYERALLSDHEREQTRIALRQAESEVEIARAALVGAGLELERSVLRAPIDGVVTAVAVVQGQVVVNQFESRPLVTLVSGDRLQAVALIDADTAARLSIGQVLTVVAGDRTLPGRVVYVGLEPSEAGAEGRSLYPLHVELDAAGLRAGQAATVRIE